MERGLYEQLVTRVLLGQLDAVTDLVTISPVDVGDQPHVLARYVESAVQRTLAATSDPRRRLELVNAVLVTLADADDAVSDPARQLHAVLPAPGPGVIAYADVRPATPLSEAALLTNTRGEPNLGSEIKAELGTADEVDLLCAFVKWYGLRLLEPELRRLRERNAPFRVITTTYIGATDRQCPGPTGPGLRRRSQDLLRLPAHPPARQGLDVPTGHNIRHGLRRLVQSVQGSTPRRSGVERPTLSRRRRRRYSTSSGQPSTPTGMNRASNCMTQTQIATGWTTPWPKLPGEARMNVSRCRSQVLRCAPSRTSRRCWTPWRSSVEVHDHHDNLVVAATGTGKTVVAALDFRRLSSRAGERPSLLFVAHRREILEQSLRTYREVLSDAEFGELYVGGARPERWRHVFASVQSLTSYGVDRIDPSAYDVVVIDEFHHAEAATYRRLLDRLEPRELLGLTATPERADGMDVRSFFGGRTAAELRLWDALGADLLCPFHYFAIADGTDLRQVAWTRGRYDDAALSNVYTGNRARAAIVLRSAARQVLDLGAMRALGFCVSVAHAEFMAQTFREAGIAAHAVSGVTPAHERARALQDLRARRLNVLFAADLFNEGLDLPDVDTLLFLRPTESATLFLQQLGRGLRRTRDKAVLTVLDFVGHHRQEFRFDRRLRALTGASRRGLERDIERGFPFLPSGCQIVMDQQSQRHVLENIRSQVGNRWPQVVSELRSGGDQDLAAFLTESGVELADIIRAGRSWTRLRRDAGLPTRAGSDRETEILKRIRAFAHVDDDTRRLAYSRLLADDASAYSDLTLVEQRLARMLFFQLWPSGGEHESIGAGFEALRREDAVRDELTAVD